MSYQTIEFRLVAGVARLTLNRPERLNAFNVQMHTEVADALGRIEADPTTRVLQLSGAGRAFCAGQDLSERDVNAGPLDLGRARALGFTLMGEPLLADVAERWGLIWKQLQRQCGLSEDYKEGVNAFKARRSPTFTGR